MPPEPIVGYITVGRGVSIHSQSCANLARLASKAPARVLPVAWGAMGAREFPVDIEVQAFDRRGLVRDVSAALADDKISITRHEYGDRRAAITSPACTSAFRSPACRSCRGVLARIAQLPNIISARRRK